MAKKISKKNILEIIAKKLKMPTMQVEKLDNFSKMKSWDSLAHLEILSALDAKLNNKVNKIKNISDIKSVKKIISILKSIISIIIPILKFNLKLVIKFIILLSKTNIEYNKELKKLFGFFSTSSIKSIFKILKINKTIAIGKKRKKLK